MSDRLQGVSWSNPLGTDELGRDVFSRLIYAGRVSLSASLVAACVATAIGLPSGLVAGYMGGAVDSMLSRFTDAIMCCPPLILAMGVIAALGPSTRNAMLAIGLVYSPRLFRISRASTLSIRNASFIDAAKALSYPRRRIIFRHVLPSLASTVIVQVALIAGFALLAEASLSFLGLGVQPPTPSWGGMLQRAYMEIHSAPFLMIPPGVAIALAVFAFNQVGDGLRERSGRSSNGN